MRQIFFIIAALIFTLTSGPASATQFVPEKIDDPFSDGKCTAMEIISYGSYIYSWPSKFDGVYWPHTEPEWMRHCPKSGYVAFPQDFDSFDDAEKQRITEYLKANYPDPRKKLKEKQIRTLAEGLYRARGRGDDFWIWFYRLLAYWAEHHDEDTEAAMAYRAKALPLIEKSIGTETDDQNKAQLLFLAGEYYHQLGNEQEMTRYFDLARQISWTDEDGEEQTGFPYFNGLIDERLRGDKD